MYQNRLKRLDFEKKYDDGKIRVRPVFASTLSMHGVLGSPRKHDTRLSRSFDMTSKNFGDKLSYQQQKNPELTIQMFFEFMRTAYQVNDSFNELSAILTANSEIDWTELAKINLNFQSPNDKSTAIENLEQEIPRQPQGNLDLEKSIQENDNEKKNESSAPENLTKKTKNTKIEGPLEDKEDSLTKLLKKNLSDVLHEGLLDSVLPYMLPKPAISQPIIKKPISGTEPKKSSSLPSTVEKSMAIPSTSSIRDKEKDRSKNCKKSLETEVEIHVCDEAKNVKKDFRCPQKLLIQKMCYFADVTAGQKLEEMDISVHCDIVIFDWLMRWVKKDIIKKSEWPILEASNVIPITVSASFLQMEPLLEQCLVFCHENMSEVLKTSTILTCLNDNIFTRLADLFSNVDVETLKDKKDKVQSRLFCKLIMSLADPIPNNQRGHYSSLSGLFKCGKCGKYVIRSASDSVPCIPGAMRIDTKGNIHSKHVRDLTWTLNDYIVNLRSELRSWRKVYWRLWGDCHSLTCRQCDTSFPINQMDWCCYHPENPQFFANEQQRATSFPLGRYPCCSQRAHRFEALINREGCRYREHIPTISADTDGHVLNIFAMHRDVISLDPPQRFFPEKITRLVARDPSLAPGKLLCKEIMWWDGIELAPPRTKLGLLGKIWGGAGVRKPCQVNENSRHRKTHQHQISQVDTTSPRSPLTSDSDEEDTGTAGPESSIDDDSNNSEESHVWPVFKSVGKAKPRCSNTVKRNDQARCWSMNLVVRYNQDNQRDFEEKAAAQMISLLTKRTTTESNIIQKLHKHHHHHHQHLSHGWNTQPIGGTYMKLEADFREQSSQLYKNKNLNHAKGPTRIRPSKS